MIKNSFSLICGHAVIDERTKHLSIFDVIERINVNADSEKTVKIPMHFDLVSVWMKSEIDNSDSGVSRISLCKPNGKSNNILEVDIDLTDSTFFRSIINFSGIELQGPGEYKFIVDFKQNDDTWEKVSEVPFTVVYKNPEEQK